MPVIQDQAIYSKRNAPISVNGSEANEGFAAAVEDAVDVNLTSHTEHSSIGKITRRKEGYGGFFDPLTVIFSSLLIRTMTI